MKDEDFDDLMRKALNSIENKKKRGYKKEEECPDCVSAKTICDFLDSRLSNSERDRVERHLSFCLFCRRLISAISESWKFEEKKVTNKVKVKEKIGAFTQTLKISLAWVQGHLKLIETDADYLPCWDSLKPVLLRCNAEKEIPPLPRFHKIFNGYKVYIQVLEEDMGRSEIQCQIHTLSEKDALSGITVDLLQAERVLFSCPVLENKDTAIFQEVRPGEYKIKIRKKDRGIALLFLSIKKES